MRASRVSRPAFFSVGRSSSSSSISAREMPCAMAPACPETPPPSTLTLTSKRRSVSVSRSGCSTTCSRRRCPRYCIGLLWLIRIRPSPGWMRTRAIAVLRRPTALMSCSSANPDVPLLVEADAPGRLRLVLVLGARVHPQAPQHVRSQTVALQHAPNGISDRERRVELLLLPQGARAKAARIARKACVDLAVHLVAGHQHPRGVDDDHVVAGVQVRCVRRLVLAFQDLGDAAGEATQSHARGIDHVPVALEVFLPCCPSLELRHLNRPARSRPSARHRQPDCPCG